ncbi:MAG: hypothetical protein AAB837_00610 [Patescibacteria group bacterium]
MPNKFTKILVVAVMASFGVAVLPIVSFAQININVPFALTNELGVEIIPTYPRPNEPVFINLTLYTDDLNSADIFWYKDGKNVLSGKGEIRYSFNAGAVGEETKIEIRINLLSGASFSKAFTLNPASIDLVWEASSYVPPFYRGKALHPRQGVLKIVALPEFVKNGQRISPANLIYNWSNDVEAYQSQSGYGKNVLVLDGSILGRSESVEVLATDPVNNLVAQSFIDISPTDPQIIFYENNPYYGPLFDSAIIGSFDLKTDEVQILAAPYYFTKESGGLLKYEWRLNGASVSNLLGSRTAIFRKPEGESGRSSVSLQVENTNRILQQADDNLQIIFKN